MRITTGSGALLLLLQLSCTAPLPLENFSLQGSERAPIRRERCSDEARREMSTLIVSRSNDEVAIRELIWAGLSTSARVGLASWLAECIQEGRPVAITSARSGGLLAHYDPDTGYRDYSAAD